MLLFTVAANPASLEEVKEAVVVIMVDNEIGAGFLITDEGHVLTARHVLAAPAVELEGEEVEIELKNGSKVQAEVIAESQNLDLAVLQIEGAVDLEPIRFLEEARSLNPPASLVLIGHPKTVDGLKKFQSEAVSISQTGEREIRVSGNIYGGNSGGPGLVHKDDDEYYVAGLLKSKEGHGQAGTLVSVESVLAFLKKQSILLGNDSFLVKRGFGEQLSEAELAMLRSIADHIRHDLIWEVVIKRAPLILSDGTSVEQRQLIVSYRKKFPGQIDPKSYKLRIYPVLDPERFDLEVAKARGQFRTKKFMPTEGLIQDIDTFIDEIMEDNSMTGQSLQAIYLVIEAIDEGAGKFPEYRVQLPFEPLNLPASATVQ